jgi:hypothetical protein
VSRLSRQCGSVNISQPYRPPRPVTGIALTLLYFYFTSTECIPGALFRRKRRRNWLLILHLELSVRYVKLHIQSPIRLHVVIPKYRGNIVFICHIHPQSENGNYFSFQTFLVSQRSIRFAVSEGAKNNILQTR